MTTATEVTSIEKLQTLIPPVLNAAMSLVIEDTAGLEAARDGKLEIKRRLKVIHDQCDPAIKDADYLHKRLIADRDRLTDDLEKADKIIDDKVKEYRREQDRLAQEEAEKARRLAEKEKQKGINSAVAKIGLLLKDAETLETRIAAMEAVLADPHAGPTEKEVAEQRLRVYQMQLDGLRDKAKEQQEVAQDLDLAPAYVPSVAAAPEKVKGLSSRKVYKVSGIDPMKLLQGIVDGSVPITVLRSWDKAFDLTALGKMKNLGIAYPGVEYTEDYSTSVRG